MKRLRAEQLGLFEKPSLASRVPSSRTPNGSTLTALLSLLSRTTSLPSVVVTRWREAMLVLLLVVEILHTLPYATCPGR